MVKLSSVAEILNGDRSSNYPSGKDFIAYGIPFINAGHLKNGKIDFSNMDYISKQKYEQLSGAKIQKKDILLCLRGSLGKYAVAEIDAGAPASSIAVIRPNKTIIASEFLTCIISSFLFQKQIDLENNGSSQPNLSASSVANFIIPFPPLDEQKRIAEALSDMDSMISSLEKLIAKKKAVKQGAMQELLTGKKRLPGFAGEWKIYKLDELLQYEQPTKYIVHSAKYTEQGIPVLTAGKSLILGYTTENDGIYENLPVIIFDDFVTSSKYITYRFKVKSSAMKMLTLKNEEMNLKLIFELMQMIDFVPVDHQRHWISQYSQFEIKLPPTIEEQTAIASILADMDNEIEALEQKLEKARYIKQGMMQQLLTGKIRLV